MADNENEATLRRYIENCREDIVKNAFQSVMAEKHQMIWSGKEWTPIHKNDVEMHTQHLNTAAHHYAKEMVGHCAALGELMTKESWKKK